MTFISSWRGLAIASLAFCSLAVLLFPSSGLEQSGSLRTHMLAELAAERGRRLVKVWKYKSKISKENVKKRIAQAVDTFEKLDPDAQLKRLALPEECAESKPTSRSSKFLGSFLKGLGLKHGDLGGEIQQEYRAKLWACRVEMQRAEAAKSNDIRLLTFEALVTFGNENSDFRPYPEGKGKQQSASNQNLKGGSPDQNLKGDSPGILNFNALIPDEAPEQDYYNAVEEGFTVPPFNQGSCGSCYAVAFYGMLSGNCWRDTGELFQLSSQQFLSCKNGQPGVGGFTEPFQPCGGGIDRTLFDIYSFVTEQGAQSIENIPYTAQQVSNEDVTLVDPGTCAKGGADTSACMAAPNKFGVLNGGTNNQMARAILKYGVVQTWIRSSPFKSGQYPAQGTILNEENYPVPDCPDLNQCGTTHAVLLVGYNMTGRYWIMKNSWGSAGISGYYFVSMDGDMSRKGFPGTLGINEQLFAMVEDSLTLGGAWETQVEKEIVNPFVNGLDPWSVDEESVPEEDPSEEHH